MRKRTFQNGIASDSHLPCLAPPRAAEYAYFVLVLYAILAPAWGIAVPLLGAGGTTLLAIYCIIPMKGNFASIYRPLALPLGCAISFVLVQIVIHGQSFMASENREFFNWSMALIIVQSLRLRSGFLNRFAIAASIIGFLLIPHMVLNYEGVIGSLDRAGLEQGVGMRNPNDLGAWFGFCCVYFIVVAIKTNQYKFRIASLLVAAGYLYGVGLTVSRSSLLAVTLATVVALRHALKRGFVPILLLVILTCGLLQSGYFDRIIESYTDRGTEETGRFLVWPLVIERFLASPYSGVGIDDLGTYVPAKGKEITPHNGFLFVALASGIIPLTFFIAYWMTAIRGAYDLSRRGMQNAPFQLPFIIYTFAIGFFGATDFMFPWAIVTMCNATPHSTIRPVEDKIRRRVRVDPYNGKVRTPQGQYHDRSVKFRTSKHVGTA